MSLCVFGSPSDCSAAPPLLVYLCSPLCCPLASPQPSPLCCCSSSSSSPRARVSRDAAILLDSSPSATVSAMVDMASSDILLLGSSGFSMWAGLFSCGLKLGSADTGVTIHEPSITLPMRHIFLPTSLTTRPSRQTFLEAPAAAAFRRAWRAYAACKANETCRPTLCSPAHLGDRRWARSRLARAAVADAAAAQWRPPPAMFGREPDAPRHEESGRLSPTSHSFSFSSASSFNAPATRGSPAMKELWALCVGASRNGTSKSGAHARAASGVSCLRQRWDRNLSAFMAARKSVRPVPKAPNAK